MPFLEVVHRDDHLIAINKPNGLLTHRTPIAPSEEVFALQLLRDQIGQRVYPIHRLDRKTSGILLFALDKETAKFLNAQFKNSSVHKKYIAIVRGYFPQTITVDYPVVNARNKLKEATTKFDCLSQAEIPIPLGKHKTSRYSYISAEPITGRMHQIRRHCNHLRHPIIGDRPHGCSKQNRLFKEKWNLHTMLLHASELRLKHPHQEQVLYIEATPPLEFQRINGLLFGAVT